MSAGKSKTPPQQDVEQNYVLANSGAAIAPTVAAITQMFSGQCSPRELQSMSLALDELLRNAYEHGNLGVGSEEKLAAIEAGNFDELLARIASEPWAHSRRIRVNASFRNGEFICRVADDGAGYDWRSTFSRALNAEDLLKPNGRGLLLIRQLFDRVEFNESGNVVTVYKKFSTPVS